jgi:hypothetical protein
MIILLPKPPISRLIFREQDADTRLFVDREIDRLLHEKLERIKREKTS